MTRNFEGRHARSIVAGGIAAACLAGCGGGSPPAPPPREGESGAPCACPVLADTLALGGAVSQVDDGSITVAGATWSLGGALVYDDAGHPAAASVLRPGMQAIVFGQPPVAPATVAAAGLVDLQAALTGPAGAVDAMAGTLTVLSQPVVVDAQTVFDPAFAGGLAMIAPGRLVEVDGQFDESVQAWRASRVAPDDAPAYFRLRGRTTAVDAGARTLRIGDASVDVSGAILASGGLPAVGDALTLALRPDPAGDPWVATLVAPDQAAVAGTTIQSVTIVVRGLVGDVVSATRFSVDGQSIDASAAAVTGTIRAGAMVDVVGTVGTGPVVASSIQVEAPTPVSGAAKPTR